MNEMIFKNPEFGQIRTVVIDSDAWFVGKDVALVLGYADVNKAIAMHVDDEDKKLNDKTSPSFGQRGATIINESGLYSLILSSKLPTAKKFKRWVTSEVLPAIRKTGGYIPHDEEMSDAEIMAKAFQISQRTIEEQHRKIGALELASRQRNSSHCCWRRNISSGTRKESSCPTRTRTKGSLKSRNVSTRRPIGPEYRPWSLRREEKPSGYCLNKEDLYFRRTGKPPMEGGEEHVVHGRNNRPWLACA